MLAAAGADGLLWRVVRGGFASGYADAAAMPAPALWAAHVYLDAEERRAAERQRRWRRT